MKTMLKSLAAAVVASAALTGFVGASAQQPASSLSELLTRIRQDSADTRAEAQRREAEFRADRNGQAARLAEAQGRLAVLEARGEELDAQFNANQARIDELSELLRAAQGDFGELFGVARQSANDVSGIIQASNISAQYPGRTELLNNVAETRTLPNREELDSIWITLLEEMIRQREVVRFTGRVGNIGADGSADIEVVRVGTFALFANDNGAPRFIDYDPGAGTGVPPMQVLGRSPASAIVGGARGLMRADAGEITSGPIDPSRGQLISLVVDTPNLVERVQQGAEVGYVIIILAIIGILFGLWRLLILMGTAGAVRSQARPNQRAKRGNPLGRIMLAAEEARGSDVETFELKLDQAIIRESSGLDFGLNFLKLAAAISPLLGLLGTVTGMIITFQQITLFGTGDPRIMADGISQALMTTVLGLVAAIPLLFVHSFASSASRSVQQILEEQSAGIVAEHAAASRG